MTIPPGAPRKAAGRIFYALTSPSVQLCKKSVIGDRKNGSPTKKNGTADRKSGPADSFSYLVYSVGISPICQAEWGGQPSRPV